MVPVLPLVGPLSLRTPHELQHFWHLSRKGFAPDSSRHRLQKGVVSPLATALENSMLQSSELSVAQVIPFVRTWMIVASLKHVEQHLWHLFRNGSAPPSVLHLAQNALVELPPEDTALTTALLASVSQSAPLASVLPQTIV